MSDEMIELQTQLSFHEDTIQQLNDVITRQQRDIEQLRLELNTLREMFKGYVEQQSENQEDDTNPPHY